jgi:hypothetical protein
MFGGRSALAATGVAGPGSHTIALLQAASAQAVADALRTIGGDPKIVDLGMEGAHDCWVLGGRDMGSFDANTRVSLWVDQESQQPVRIDDGSGPQYRFGSPKKGETIRFPAWPELAHRREVREARPMTAPPPCAILGPPTGGPRRRGAEHCALSKTCARAKGSRCPSSPSWTKPAR